MFVMILLLSGSLSAAVPDELRRYHELAMKQSETLEMAKSRMKQAEEREDQALGTLFPNINARYNYTEIDPPPAPRSAFTRINQYSGLINLNQPLFRGAGYPAFKFTKKDTELQKRLVEQAGLGLWQEVALAYYTGWSARNDLANVSMLRKYSDERVSDLKERVRVGRSRRGELNQAEAQLLAVDAEIARASQAALAAEERIAFLTGLPQTPVYSTLPQPALSTSPLEEYLQQAKSRPDLKASSQQVAMADDLISGSKAGHLPSVDFNSNYYLERTGVLQDSSWDIGVAVNIPIYQGGVIQGQVREQVERKRESVLAYERLKREIERDVRILWNNSRTLDKVVSDLRKSLEKAKVTYEANKKDYSYGLVTNLDVLLTLNQYIETKRNFENAVIEKELIALQITLAAGATP